MKNIVLIFSGYLLFAGITNWAGGTAVAPPTNRAIAETPSDVSVSLPKTGTAVDGGSILNDIKFSDGRLYRLVLDTPFSMSTDELRYTEIHFRIVRLPDRSQSEVLEHGSAAEHRLIQLLKSLIATTKDPHEKKNANSLVRFLNDRKQGFPMGRKWWDFTPWQVDWNKIKPPPPNASPNPRK
jgi:hypothetical protein